jgi:hypothetical protein
VIKLDYTLNTPEERN